jgi:hypothetical protein
MSKYSILLPKTQHAYLCLIYILFLLNVKRLCYAFIFVNLIAYKIKDSVIQTHALFSKGGKVYAFDLKLMRKAQAAFKPVDYHEKIRTVLYIATDYVIPGNRTRI